MGPDPNGLLNGADQVVASAQRAGLSAQQGRGMIERMVDQESFALATTHIFSLAAGIFFISAMLIWMAPPPRKNVDTSAAH